MVSATLSESTPNLVPVPPDWLANQGQQGPSTNVNINDIYWKKGPRESDPGWIIIGPSAELGSDGRPLTRQAESWIRKGRTPLVELSYTNRVSQRTGRRETLEMNADRLGTPDRYYWLFRNGGASLFTIEQIVAHHWHITPPFGLSLEVFPQLKEWEVPDPFFCGACTAEAPPRNSEEELISHLIIGHRMTLPAARDLINSYDVHERPRAARGLTIRRKAQAFEQAAAAVSDQPSPDQPKSRLIVCDDCGESFADGLAKARHVKKGHEPASQPADAMNGPVESLSHA